MMLMLTCEVMFMNPGPPQPEKRLALHSFPDEDSPSDRFPPKAKI